MIRIKKPYLIYLADIKSGKSAKTAFGLRDWIGNDVIGQFRRPGCGFDLGLDDLSPNEAVSRGAQSLVLGIAPDGGRIEPHWVSDLVRAVEAGLDIVSGLHTRLASLPALAEAAARAGRALHDVRYPGVAYSVGTGQRRSGKRLLTVGTDCALGKKYTALAIARGLQARGIDARFRATGQTGIMIAGEGVPIDATIADFLSGAAEALSPAAAADHWDVIEGQGSLFHPSYAAVTLGLVHGSQPDAMVLCHDPLRTEIDEMPGFAIPPLDIAAARYVEAARLTNPEARIVAVALNTSAMGDTAAVMAAKQAEDLLGVPCCDPMRFGLDAVLDRIGLIT